LRKRVLRPRPPAAWVGWAAWIIDLIRSPTTPGACHFGCNATLSGLCLCRRALRERDSVDQAYPPEGVDRMIKHRTGQAVMIDGTRNISESKGEPHGEKSKKGQ